MMSVFLVGVVTRRVLLEVLHVQHALLVLLELLKVIMEVASLVRRTHGLTQAALVVIQ